MIEWAAKQLSLGKELQPEIIEFLVELLSDAINVVDKKDSERDTDIARVLLISKKKHAESEHFWIAVELLKLERKYRRDGKDALNHAIKMYLATNENGPRTVRLLKEIYKKHRELAEDYLDGTM